MPGLLVYIYSCGLNSKVFLTFVKFILHNVKCIVVKTQFLISHRFVPWGWALLVLGSIWTVISVFGEYEPDVLDWRVPALWGDNIILLQNSAQNRPGGLVNNVADELGGLATLLGALLLLLAREKTEDELINKVRLESLLWAAMANALFNIGALVFIYGIPYFHVMIVNVVFFYLLFLGRFRWVLRQLKKSTHEE